MFDKKYLYTKSGLLRVTDPSSNKSRYTSITCHKGKYSINFTDDSIQVISSHHKEFCEEDMVELFSVDVNTGIVGIFDNVRYPERGNNGYYNTLRKISDSFGFGIINDYCAFKATALKEVKVFGALDPKNGDYYGLRVVCV
jgi:hypothetical protein